MSFALPKLSEIGGMVEDGVYIAKLTDYEGPKQGKWGDVIDFTFQITKGEYQGERLDYRYVGVASKKLLTVCAALNGGEYDDDADLDDYLGKPVKITVEQVDKGDKGIFSNITGIKPAPATAATPARKKKPVEPEPDEFMDDDDDEDFV